VLTAERLRDLLHYDPDTGVWSWLVRQGRACVGATAGWVRADGYRQIRVDGRAYRAHRLAFLYMTGRWPPRLVDHKNVVPGDDRWCNLRPATESQNQHNRGRAATNTSGLKGASFSKHTRKWLAQIAVRGVRKYLGYFDTPEEAHAAYVAASQQHHGEFARAA
jgi:hypothetical protein